MSQVAERLTELGWSLPDPPRPLAAYSPVVASGGWLYTAGQLPIRDGKLVCEGIVGGDVAVQEAAHAAALSAVNGLAALATQADLDHIQIVKVTGFVAAAVGFTQHPIVVNGASELLAAALLERGVHARSAVGVASLPLNAPVEVEIVARVLGQGDA